MNHDPMNPPDENRAAIRALLETLHRQQGAVAIPNTDELVRWLDGTLPAERAAAVELALARHPELRHALTALRLGHEESVPTDELARLEHLVPARIAAEVAPFPSTHRNRAIFGYAAAAAAAVALLVPAWTIGSGIAEQRRTAEDRALSEFLNGGVMKGGL